MSEQCFVCGQGNPHTLEEHHTVPRRYNGSDTAENLYSLCGSCHNAIEAMYDDEFYERLGIAVGNDQLLKDSGTGGEIVEPQQSKGRKIPPGSEHIEYERWQLNLTVSDLAKANRGEYTGQYQEFIEDNVNSILERFGKEAQRAKQRTKRHEKDNPDLYEDIDESRYQPRIAFVFEHSEVATVPYLKVVNVNRHSEHEIEHSHAEIEQETHSPQTRSMQSLPVEEYPDYYRLHCGYCHTVFSQHQHEDLGRHLKVKHGIDVHDADVTAKMSFNPIGEE